MMPLDLFASRSFTGANVLTFLLYGALGGALFFLPFSLVQVHGYTPAQAGAAWLPFILCVGLLSRWTGGLVPVTGARILLVAGPLVTSLGFVLAVLPGAGGDSYWRTFFPTFLTMGIGMALAVAPLVSVVMTAAGRERAGIASGINNAISRAAGLVTLAIMGLLMVTLFNQGLERRLGEGRVRPDVLTHFEDERVNLAAARAPAIASPEERQLIDDAVRESFLDGFRVIMLVAAALAAASAMVAWRTIPARSPDGART